jgi:hypothetical protein
MSKLKIIRKRVTIIVSIIAHCPSCGAFMKCTPPFGKWLCTNCGWSGFLRGKKFIHANDLNAYENRSKKHVTRK